MDPGAPRTAADVVNTYSAGELARVLRVYGEERFASRIAKAIERERGRVPFTRTGRLAELVRDSIPAATRRTGGHPAKRTFQALRIEVNDELGVLERALPAAIEALAVGGRIAVITFHSLEDRIVKQTLAAGALDRTPPDMPMPLPELGPVLRLLTRGGEAASEAETAANPRAASARVRAAERIRRAA
jgi:16S rRNA (cytosine1402-N4)-methyltransferase